MTTTSSGSTPQKERTTELARSAQRIIDTLRSATPQERTTLIKDNREQLQTLALVLDGLQYRGVLPDASDTAAGK